MNYEICLFGEKSVTLASGQVVRGVFDTALMSEAFDRSEVRAMSRQSIVMRWMARKLMSENLIHVNTDACGVYFLSNDGDSHPRIIDQYFSKKNIDISDFCRLLPAKYAISTPASMCAAQVAIETNSRGPVLSVLPGFDSLESLIIDLKLDKKLERVSQAFVGYTFSATDPFEKLATGNRENNIIEVAYLTYLNFIDDLILEKVKQNILSVMKGGPFGY